MVRDQHNKYQCHKNDKYTEILKETEESMSGEFELKGILASGQVLRDSYKILLFLLRVGKSGQVYEES